VPALLVFVKDAGEEGPAMSDHDVDKILDKLRKLRARRNVRGRVRQLERELNREPAKPESAPNLPEFLTQHARSGSQWDGYTPERCAT
jgi:hypothetical protein